MSEFLAVQLGLGMRGKPSNSKRLLVLIGGPVLLLYLAYSIIFPTYHVRYRLEFVVKDHDTMRTGTGVVEVAYQLMPDLIAVGPWLPPGGASHVYGRAITIDLAKRGLLFVVFSGASGGAAGDMGRLPWVAYRISPPYDGGTFRDALRQLRQKSGWADIPANEMLQLVRFRSIDDPKSAELVDPENLAAAYGEGVKLVSARLELTRDPITETPTNWPAWLMTFDSGTLGGATFPKPGPLALQAADFKGS